MTGMLRRIWLKQGIGIGIGGWPRFFSYEVAVKGCLEWFGMPLAASSAGKLTLRCPFLASDGSLGITQIN